MAFLDELLLANEQYAAEFKRGGQPIPPAKGVAILTCMDSRIDPFRLTGMTEGDAHIIRNAGGRASDDAIRSLIVSHKLLGTNKWLVIHHTDCGLEAITNQELAGLLEQSLDTVVRTPDGLKDVGSTPGSPEGKYINWLAFDDPIAAIREDVARIKNHPLVSPDILVLGFIYDVRTGKLNPVD